MKSPHFYYPYICKLSTKSVELEGGFDENALIISTCYFVNALMTSDR